MEAAQITEARQSQAAGDDSEALDTFLRLARVKQLTDSSKSTIWRWIKAGKFPRPVVQDGNTVLWSQAQIRTWQQSKLRAGCAKVGP